MDIDTLINNVIEKLSRRKEEIENLEGSYYGEDIEQRIIPTMDQYREVMQEYENALPARLKALTSVLHMYTNEDYRATYSYDTKSVGSILTSDEFEADDLDAATLRVSTYNEYDWKCNKLVADAYAVGASVGLSIGTTLGGDKITGNGYPAAVDCQGAHCYLWAPQANILARQNHNLRSLTHAKPIRQQGDLKAQPELGDIVCFPTDGGLGHSSLYLGKKLIISAKGSGIEIETEEYETEEHNGLARIRKFTGSGR